MWIALWTATAHAQVPVPELNSQLFRPSLDSRYTLWTNDSIQQENHTMLGRVVVHYTNDPLTFIANDDTVTRVISDVVQADVAGGYQLGPMRFGLDLPVFMFADGADKPSQAGFGDLALDVKGTVLQRADSPIGLAFLGRMAFPTANIDGLAAGNTSFEAEAIVDQEVSDKVFIGVNAGFRAIPDAGLENWTDNVYARLAGGYKTSDMSGLSLELISHGITSEGAPSEVLLGGWGRAAKGLHMRGGLGTALGRGIGTPQLRAMFGLAFEPTFEPDTDMDGLSDFDDDCPEKAEDPDGVEDSDGCPEPTKVTIRLTGEEDADLAEGTFALEPSGATGKSGETAEVFGGSYELKVMAEGYDTKVETVAVQDVATQDVTIALEKTIVLGTLTVKVTNPEGEAIAEATWTAVDTEYEAMKANGGAEVLPDSYDLKIAADGYRGRRVTVAVAEGEEKTIEVELQPARVEIVKERITINESIFFETGKAVIKEESFGLLDEMSELIVDHPELTKIRIEGHTDSRGSAKSNKTLSQRRAESVRAYMIGKGVEEDRLEAVGFGEEKPLDPANTKAAWEKNRRVDFFVAGRSD